MSLTSRTSPLLPKLRSKSNKPLPSGWRFRHGAYSYRVPDDLRHFWDGKSEFKLGRTLSEAHKTFAERIGPVEPGKIRVVGQLLDEYLLRVVPNYRPKTQASKLEHVKNLRKVFHSSPVHGFKPAWVYGYIEHRVNQKTGEPALTAAHREIETLSHAFTKLVQWGGIDRHPFKDEVRLDGDLALQARTRYVEDWLSLQPRRKAGSVRMLQAYVRLKLLTGLARSDLLRLAETTGKTTIYEYERVPERLEAVRMALTARPALSPFLFCNRRGEGYIDEETDESHGFDSMWQRFMGRVLAETSVTKRFTEHDIRAKAGSDAESLERARALLQHADARTTQRIYRRKPERV